MKPSLFVTSGVSLLMAVSMASVGRAQTDAGTPPLSSASPQNAQVPQQLKLALPTASGPATAALTTAQDHYPLGRSILLTFTVMNPTKSEVAYDFSTSQQADFAVLDAKGTEIWRWSHEQVFAQMLTRFSLKPNAHKTFTALWSGRDAKGQPIPAGVYTLNAWLTASNRPAVTGGLIVNPDTDPNNMGMPTRSPADNGAIREISVKPTVTASKTVTIGSAMTKKP